MSPKVCNFNDARHAIWSFIAKIPVILLVATSLTQTGCLPQEGTASEDAIDKNPKSKFGLLSAQTVGATKVKLTWPKSSNPETAEYRIYDVSLEERLLKIVPASSGLTEVTITRLTPQQLYKFRVRTADANGKTDDNKIDLAAIPYAGIEGSNVLDSVSAIVTFADATDSDAIEIYCHTSVDPIETLMMEVTDTTLKQAVITGLNGGIEYTCRAALKKEQTIDNNTVTTSFIPVGTAASLAFSTQPGSAVAGSPFLTQPVIRILDANGTLVSAGPDSEATVSLELAMTSPSSGTIRGAISVTAVAGIATFSDLSMQEAGTKIINATKSDTSSLPKGSAAISANSAQFIISPDAVSADKSSITISPDPNANGPLVADGILEYTATITLKDKFNNPIPGITPSFGSTVTGDTITKPTAKTDDKGQSTGKIQTTIADKARNLFIKSPAGLTTDTVNAPFINGPAAKLGFITQPANAGAGVAMANMTVAIQDTFGNTVLEGASSTADVSMAISANVNNATLSGTTTVKADAGIATFTDLSINKIGSGYKLLANSGTFTPAYSNTFNITAGSPYKIKVTGATSVLSGVCSGALTIQLQDSGNNPATAIVNTPITISGLGGGFLYSSASCGGSAQGATLTFQSGTSTKTLYFKDNKSEAAAITATDPSHVLTTGTLTMNVAPSKIALSVSSPTVIAGQCSAAITITPEGEDGTAGPTFSPASVNLTGILGSSAALYGDAGCTQSLVSTAITLPISQSSNYSTNVYVKDNKAETLSLGISDNSGTMTPAGGLKSLTVLASNILFEGQPSVVSGACSSAYTVTLTDAAGTAVAAPANKTVNIHGLENSTTGYFYLNSACSGTPTNTTVTVPQGSAAKQIFFKDSSAESLHIYFSDPDGQLANSNTLNIGISPSAFRLTGSVVNTNTTVCEGPFTLATLDGANHVTAAITPITAIMTGAGTAAAFYTDGTCTTALTTLSFAQGDSQKQFYFMGQYPATGLSFQAADQANTLSPATYAFAVKASAGFIGTAAQPIMNAGGTLNAWFLKGKTMVTSRYDGAQSIRSLHFNTDAANPKQYLYITDMQGARILKYDYTNKKYIGWIGALYGDNAYNYIAGARADGSTLTTPSAADCIGTGNFSQLPGWCIGGMPYRIGTNNGFGSFYQPTKLVDDGVGNIYVVDRLAYGVLRYSADTGAFKGWIGTVQSTPVANSAITDLSSACTSKTNGQGTPGWCYGGLNRQPPTWNTGADSSMEDPRSLAYAGGYLYVGAKGAIKKFDAATGAYLGWIGMVSTAPTGTGTGGVAGCTSKVSGDLTPGWCMGGTYQVANMRTSPGAVNFPTDLKVIGTKLYVLSTDSGGVVAAYDVATGTFLGQLTNLHFDWTLPQEMVTDGTYLYIADHNRIIRVDPITGTVTGWLGKASGQPTSDVAGAIAGCTNVTVNSNTPGWCLGGTAMYGADEGSFLGVMGIELDGAGNLLAGGRDWYYGAGLQIFDATTGAYGGTLAYQSASPSQWSNDSNAKAQLESFDDRGMNTPSGIYNDGSYLYVTELGASRVKKVDLKTGATVGWVGAVATEPTGGSSACIGQNGMSFALGWCLGSLYIPDYRTSVLLPANVDGVFYHPISVTGDGTYIYVLDFDWHRIQKFKASDGSYQGWIGKIGGTSGLGGGVGCSTALVNTFTPTWCKGGTSTFGSGNGELRNPESITYAAGTLYVVDGVNQRISSYDAATGAFKGWIGRVSSTVGISGCTTASPNGYTISSSGWCFGGTSTVSANDKGGGFNFIWSRNGITTDGTSTLYIANSGNSRIDKFNLNGQFLGAVSTNYTVYTNTWVLASSPTALGNMYTGNMFARGLHVDSTNLYFMLAPNYANQASVLVKMDLATGNIVGWKGYVLPGYPAANNGEAGKSGCAGLRSAISSEWCQGGINGYSLYMGGFWTGIGITGDQHYIYVTDESTHRLTRVPK